MEPITASTLPSRPRPASPSGLSFRRLWQAPVFFIGVTAVVTAGLTRGLVVSDPARQLHHHLAEARRLLQHHARDPDAAVRHARLAVEKLAHDPARAAEAYFLFGWAQLQKAELPSEAASSEAWRQAKESLQEAQVHGLAGDDEKRLHYCLGKIAFHFGEAAGRVIELLKDAGETSDDRAEVLALLGQAYERLEPPNWKKALEVNRQLREVAGIGADVLGPAKLAGAKLLLHMDRRDEARNALEKISDRAPPPVLAEKNLLLAGLYQEANKWAEAQTLWRMVLAQADLAPTARSKAQYYLGVCCRQLKQSKEAAEAWSDCLSHAQGEVAQAAALGLAELNLQGPNLATAVVLLGQVVAKVRKDDDWNNSLVDLSRLRQVFEKAIAAYRQARSFELAVQSAALYERVAEPPRALVLRAELGEEWARAQRQHARAAKDESKRKTGAAAADEWMRQAAEAHGRVATLLRDKHDQDEHRWRSAVCSFEGHDFRAAADKLTKIVAEDGANVDRLSEGWFLLGETCRQLGDAKAGCEAYKTCIVKNGRYIGRARYQLALSAIAAGQIDNAVHELEQNLSAGEYRRPDPEVREQSLFALCSLLYQGGQQRNYRRIVQLLENRLDHCTNTAEAVRARLQLADSYCRLTDGNMIHFSSDKGLSEDAREHLEEVNHHDWTRAAGEYAKLEELIKQPELAELLTAKQQDEIPFRVAECYFNLGKYKEALHKFDALAARWGNRPLGVWALSQTVRCFAGMKEDDKLHQRAEQIRAMLAGTEGFTVADRHRWMNWLNLVNKKVASTPRQPY